MAKVPPATPIQCRCPNCGHRLCDIVSGVVEVKCQIRGGRGCGHTIRFTRDLGSNQVVALDKDLGPAAN